MLAAEDESPDNETTGGSWPPAAKLSFGDYELLEEIGHGGMGVVYRARQRSLDRVVAIKMIAFGPGSSPDFIKRFRAEAVSAASLHHPNIVAVHEVGIHEGRHFFVMDYVEGQSLARLVGNQPLAARRAAGYLKTIAEAVHYAHERGILHRDLKPSNVLIDARDQPHLVDFGLARRLEGDSELTVTGQVLGSPHYLPPEQAAGQRARVSRRTDVYALGATLYHLLTGRPPFQAESLAQTLDFVLHTEPVAPRLLNPSVPRDLETICLKCLEKEQGKRSHRAGLGGGVGPVPRRAADPGAPPRPGRQDLALVPAQSGGGRGHGRCSLEFGGWFGWGILGVAAGRSATCTRRSWRSSRSPPGLHLGHKRRPGGPERQ
jgi:serine/threonine protein kinase